MAVKQPYYWGVVYKRPNPGGAFKCETCVMWVRQDTDGKPKCVVHPRSLEVPPDFFCGYHIYGQPMPKWMDHPGMQPLEPKHSGARKVGAGIVCRNCRYYTDHDGRLGLCSAITSEKRGEPPATVEAMGVCARHESI